MKLPIASALICFFSLYSAYSQEPLTGNLLDGTSMDYFYQNGSAVHAQFTDGNFQFEWFLGPNKGATGSCTYQSRKIGDKLYMVGFSYEPTKAYVTIVFNFNQMMFSTSAWLMAGTEQEIAWFEAGIIEKLILVEH
jgi:hypothetical protein